MWKIRTTCSLQYGFSASGRSSSVEFQWWNQSMTARTRCQARLTNGDQISTSAVLSKSLAVWIFQFWQHRWTALLSATANRNTRTKLIFCRILLYSHSIEDVFSFCVFDPKQTWLQYLPSVRPLYRTVHAHMWWHRDGIISHSTIPQHENRYRQIDIDVCCRLCVISGRFFASTRYVRLDKRRHIMALSLHLSITILSQIR